MYSLSMPIGMSLAVEVVETLLWCYVSHAKDLSMCSINIGQNALSLGQEQHKLWTDRWRWSESLQGTNHEMVHCQLGSSLNVNSLAPLIVYLESAQFLCFLGPIIKYTGGLGSFSRIHVINVALYDVFLKWSVFLNIYFYSICIFIFNLLLHMFHHTTWSWKNKLVGWRF